MKPRQDSETIAQLKLVVATFKATTDLCLPHDLVRYLEIFETRTCELDKDLFAFYPLNEFKSVSLELTKWRGTPNYQNIIHTLKDSRNCFVFADYMFHLFVYAIRLHKNEENVNEVYLICGDQYKEVANSFPSFCNYIMRIQK